MAQKVKAKTKPVKRTKASSSKGRNNRTVESKKSATGTRRNGLGGRNNGVSRSGGSVQQVQRRESLRQMLSARRQEIVKEIQEDLGNSLTADQQRRHESGMDSGDEALMDLDRELGISLLEMRDRRRRQIEEALLRLDEGNYGICAECEIEISEKRLAAVPFAKLCVDCQSRQELLEKIEKGEERD